MTRHFTNGTLTAAAEALILGVGGHAGVGIQLTGTFVGTLQFEVTIDGQTWRALNMTPSNSTSATTSATAAGLWFGAIPGAAAVRVKCSAYTSGSINVLIGAVQAAPGGGGGAGGGGGDGAILDGVDGGIKATVFDYANAKPLAVVLRDTSGDYVSVGGGTQYTEDDAAAANPVGTVPMLIRKDTLAAVTGTDGDNVAARGTNKGELYVKHADSVAITSSALAQDATVSAMAGDLGDTADAEATGDGSVIAVLKRLRTLLGALLPQTRSDTFIATGNGTAVDASAIGVRHLALQVTETGTVDSWTVVLEGSLDGTTYTTIASHTKAGDGSGGTVWTPQPVPCRHFRSRCSAISLGAGTNVVARILGMN